MDIIEEVNEEVRQERMLALWKKFSPFIMATVVGILVVALVFIGWDYYRNNVRSQLAEQYTKALMLGSEGRLEESAVLLASLKNKAGSQYGTLGKLSQALIAVKDGKESNALALYEDVANDTSVSDSLRGFARLQAAKYHMKAGKLDQAQQSLEGLTKPGAKGNAVWRPLAMELEGMVHMKKGNKAEAYKVFNNLSLAKTTPEPMKNRVKVLQAQINASGEYSVVDAK